MKKGEKTGVRKKMGIKNIEFGQVFKSSPAPYLLLFPDKQFTIAEVSDSYSKATNTARKEIIGRPLFEVFPDNPNDPKANGVNNLRASLLRVLKYKKPDAMPMQKYDIPRPASMGGGFEVRYWDPLNMPVLDKSKKVKYIIHYVMDVTDIVKLKEKQTAQLEWAKKLEVAERQHIQNIRKGETLFLHLTQNLMNHAIFMLDAEGNVASWNNGAEKLIGYKTEEILGKHISVFYTGEGIEKNEPKNHLTKAVTNGRYHCNLTGVKKDKSIYQAHIILTPVYNDAGLLTGFTCLTQIFDAIKTAVKVF